MTYRIKFTIGFALLAALTFMLTAKVARAGEAAPTSASLRLIPTPQQVQLATGRFELRAGERVTLGSAADAADRFALAQLLEETSRSLGLTLREGRPLLRAPRILLARLGRDQEAARALKRLGATLPRTLGEEGYLLDVSPRGVTVLARGSAGLFYGVQTLKQLVRANATGRAIPCCRILDWPAMKIRCWQDDVTRGPVPTMAMLKRQVRTIAEYKMNHFTMYFEHAFKLKKHPKIAPPDGLSAEDVAELTRYARDYHVEVIGCYQSFGHVANTLNVPEYAHLGEDGWKFAPANEAVYQFLDDVYGEMAPVFSSPYFNICCDETNPFKPDGPSGELLKKMGQGGLYAYHVNRAAALLKKRGKTPLMWGDVALHYPEVVPQLPKDLTVLTWGYGPGEDYEAQILPFKKLGLRFIICPGVQCWNRLWPDLDIALTNIFNFTRDGARHGALGMINTSWDDSGENLNAYNWLPALWGAECSWNPATTPVGPESDRERERRLAAFNRAYDALFYRAPATGLAEQLCKLGFLSGKLPQEGPRWNIHNEYIFWSDNLELLPPAVEEPTLAWLGETIATYQALQARVELARDNQDSLAAALFAGQRLMWLGRRERLFIEIRRGADLTQIDRGLQDLIAHLKRYKPEYERLWRAESREWFLQFVTPRFDKQIAFLEGRRGRVLFSPSGGLLLGPQQVELFPLGPGQLHYTLDGSEPTAASPRYSAPIAVSRPLTIKARLLDGAKDPLPADTAPFTGLLRPAKIQSPWPAYLKYVPDYVFDGSDETYFLGAASPAAGDAFTVTLEKPEAFKRVRALTDSPKFGGTSLREGVLEVSLDGATFAPVAEFKEGKAEGALDPSRKVKAVRIRVTKSQPWWLAIRSITLE